NSGDRDAGITHAGTRINAVDAGRVRQLQLVVGPHHVIGRHIESATSLGEIGLVAQLVIVHQVRFVVGGEEGFAALPVHASGPLALGVQAVNHLAVVEGVTQADLGNELLVDTLAAQHFLHRGYVKGAGMVVEVIVGV